MAVSPARTRAGAGPSRLSIAVSRGLAFIYINYHMVYISSSRPPWDHPVLAHAPCPQPGWEAGAEISLYVPLQRGIYPDTLDV